MNRIKLLEVLEKVKPGLASKEIMDQSICFAFIRDGVMTYNDEISVFCPFKGLNVEGVVKGEEFYSLLKKMVGNEVEISKEDSKLILTKEGMRAELLSETEIVLPNVNSGNFEWKFLPDDFLEGVGFCIFSCSNDLTQPVFSCIHVDGERKVLESTDNYRLSRFHLRSSGDMDSSFLLPVTSARELVHYEVSKVAFSEGWIHFGMNDGCVFSVRAHVGEFPDVDGIFSKFEEEDVTDKIYLPKGLESILDRAMVFSKREYEMEEVVRLSFREGKLIVESEGVVGHFKEEVDVKYKGKEVSFLINPSYLQDICKKTGYLQVVEDSMVKFENDNWVHVISLVS